MSDYIRKFHNDCYSLMDVHEYLLSLSRAFQTTGNNTMAKKLSDTALYVKEIKESLKANFSNKIDNDYKTSQEDLKFITKKVFEKALEPVVNVPLDSIKDVEKFNEALDIKE